MWVIFKFRTIRQPLGHTLMNIIFLDQEITEINIEFSIVFTSIGLTKRRNGLRETDRVIERRDETAASNRYAE